MKAQATAAQARTTASSAIEKLQTVLVMAEKCSQKALQCSQTNDHLASGRALVAIGLCQQAKEQVRVACQNLGFSMNSLLLIDEKATGAGAEEQQQQLKAARAAVVRLLVRKINVSREAVFISMQAFAEESAIMAAIMVSRAEKHLKVCAR